MKKQTTYNEYLDNDNTPGVFGREQARKKRDNKYTAVKFLIEKPEGDLPCQVFAFFPNDIYTHTSRGTFTSYAHVGQHSPCHIDYANECKEATPEQYADLKSELESIGYKLKVLNPNTL